MAQEKENEEPAAEGEMSFLDHLEELRWHVVRSVAAVMILMIAAFLAAPWIFDNIIFAPTKADFPTFRALCRLSEVTGLKDLCLQLKGFKLQSRYMTGQFSMQFMSAFVIGLIVAFPYVFWEMWRFVKPGLYNKERKSSKGAVFAVTLLFAMGVSFGYFVMCPMSIWFFSSYTISDLISNEFDITSYVQTMVALVFGSGLLFQLPVVIFFLTRIGLVTPKFLRTYRKHSIVVILVIAAIITPPDPLSQTIIALPLYLLFEISIFISGIEMKRKLRVAEEEAKADERTA